MAAISSVTNLVDTVGRIGRLLIEENQRKHNDSRPCHLIHRVPGFYATDKIATLDQTELDSRQGGPGRQSSRAIAMLDTECQGAGESFQAVDPANKISQRQPVARAERDVCSYCRFTRG